MGFLWFVAAVVFFILWLTSNSAKNRQDKTFYDRGYEAGRRDAIEALEKDLKKGALTKEELETYRDTPVAQPSATLATSSDSAGFLPGERVTEDSVEEPDLVVEEVIAAPIATPADLQKAKAEQTNRNLNILLYAASFLIIAAAAAFVATSMPASVRLVSLWAVIMAFYIVGLVLHARTPYLRSAATAFVGTGLALIPFAGIALSQLGGLSGGWSWAVTSLIGVICYGIATVRLSSNIVAYLTIAFSLSLAASTVAVVSGPMVLYFVVLIVVSLLFHILAHINASWVPELLKRPIEQAGHLLTPLTLVGSIFAYGTMTSASYQIVFWVATLYYLVIWFTARKYVYELAVRVLATVALLITALDIVDFNPEQGLWVWLGVLALHGVYSVARVRTNDSGSKLAETIWYWVIIAVSTTTLSLWAFTDVARLGLITQVSFMLALSVAMAWRLHSVYPAIPLLFTLLALPVLIGRWPGEELLSITATVYVYVALASVALVTYRVFQARSLEIRGYLQAAFWLYLMVGFFWSFAQGSFGAFALSTGIIAALIVDASYLYRQWGLEGIAAVLVIPIVATALVEANAPIEWRVVMTVGASALVYMIGILIHQVLKQESRRNLLTGALLIVGLGLVGGVFSGSEPVRTVASALAALYAVVALAVRIVTQSSFLRNALTVAYVGYPFVALLAAVGLGANWFVLLFAIATFIYWAASYVEKSEAFLIFGNLALVGLLISAWNGLKLDPSWLVIGVAWAAAVVYYLSYLLYAYKYTDEKRRTVQLVFTWLALAIPTMLYFWASDDKGYAAVASLLAVSATIVAHGVLVSQKALVEMGIYAATLALQRWLGLALPELHFVLYAHWWALTVAVVAYWRRGDAKLTTRLVIAVALVTVSSGLEALATGGYYQLLFLIEHVILLIVGALSRTSWALWWGLAATVLAVLYFLKSSLFLSLLFLGLTLLGVVIWRLIRAQKKR